MAPPLTCGALAHGAGVSHNHAVKLSAKVDYAIRAALELAAADPNAVKAEAVARAQGIPHAFLENIFADLRRAGLVHSQRGAQGGYRLARSAQEITVADVMRIQLGHLVEIHGERPEDLEYPGAAASMREVWVAVRASMRGVLDQVTLADVVAGDLPPPVEALLRPDEAWRAGYWHPAPGG